MHGLAAIEISEVEGGDPMSGAGGAAVVLTDGSVLLVGGGTYHPAGEYWEPVVLASAIRFAPPS